MFFGDTAPAVERLAALGQTTGLKSFFFCSEVLGRSGEWPKPGGARAPPLSNCSHPSPTVAMVDSVFSTILVLTGAPVRVSKKSCLCRCVCWYHRICCLFCRRLSVKTSKLLYFSRCLYECSTESVIFCRCLYEHRKCCPFCLSLSLPVRVLKMPPLKVCIISLSVCTSIENAVSLSLCVLV